MKRTIILLAISNAIWGQKYVDPVRPQDVIPGGAINGKAIDAVVFKAMSPCALLKDRIQRAARDEAAQSLGVTVTSKDIEAVRASITIPDPVAESKTIVEKATLVLAAWAAVDKGQEAHQVYLQMLQPKGMSGQEWNLHLTQGRNPDYRARIAKQSSMTPEAVSKGIAAMDLKPMAMARKLDDMIDQLLAKNDATFKVVLDRWNASARIGPNHQVQHSGPLEEQQYMDKQRASWWKGRISMMTVTLNDPTLAARCKLSDIGVATR